MRTLEGFLQTMKKYHIAVGPDVNSIILTQHIHDNSFIITKYITKIDLKYLQFLDSY